MIVRHPHEASYAVIQNATLCDSRLSWKARGILGYLLSKPDGWRVMVANLVNEAPDGRGAVLTGLKELERAGYLVRHGMKRTNGGTFDGPDAEIRECPEGGWPTAVQKSARGSADRGESAVGNSAPIEDPIQQLPMEPITDGKESTCDALLGFQEFWTTYPRRNGKRLRRAKCEEIWTHLPLEDRRAAWRGARNYAAACAAGLTIAKDPERFLGQRDWTDWQDPATADPPRRDRGNSDGDPRSLAELQRAAHQGGKP